MRNYMHWYTVRKCKQPTLWLVHPVPWIAFSDQKLYCMETQQTQNGNTYNKEQMYKD